MRKYSKQFKLSAIQAFLDRGYGFRHVAAQFQMDPTLLRRWVVAYRTHGQASLEKTGRHYSAEFKLAVLHHKWREDLSLRATSGLYNLGNSTLVRSWEEQYYSGGHQPRPPRKEPVITAMPKAPRKSEDVSSMPTEQLTREQLLTRLAQLEAENAYLKKLEELDEKKARKKIARKKPG
ncbi:transposase [Pseudomonas putida]|uniref:transposase n=1 Tax=Pseudomonas putida TaxID=303 RepID=UPI0018A92AD0|nr:helix-turn-helix domain-containing protein [Pseudomonas putida]MBF8661119.1 transposase [Pseudomonas putida]